MNPNKDKENAESKKIPHHSIFVYLSIFIAKEDEDKLGVCLLDLLRQLGGSATITRLLLSLMVAILSCSFGYDLTHHSWF